MIGKRIALLSAAAVVATTVGACGEKGLSYGDPNSVIAVMGAEQWEAVDDAVYEAFEKTITTVRDEKKFTVTYQEPYAEFWLNLRRFRQMLVVGAREDPWVGEVLEEAREPIESDGVHQVYDVWATGQTITLVLLPTGWTPEDLQPHLVAVSTMLDNQYRAYARNRMYMSGLDTALADTLETEQGFGIDLPDVYRWSQEGNTFVFRNDNPDPSELIREIVVTWQTPALAALTAEGLVEWRTRLVASYAEPQDMILDGLVERSFDFDGHEALEVQAQWRNPPERSWPAGGPFLTRAVTCEEQDRTYVLDAWLYAPGKEKYEYMIQLETILDSFRCVT